MGDPKLGFQVKTVRLPSGQKKLDLEQIQHELAWRQWFPDVQWNPVGETDDEAVDRLADAFHLFCLENIMVKYPGRGMVSFDLREAQIETVRHWLKHRYTIILKSRQVGFSTLASVFVLWAAIGWPDRHIVLLSKGQREARKLLQKSRYAYRKMPEWVVQRGPRLIDKTLERMTFDNESLVESLPSNSDPARGESVYLVVVDEWASLLNQEEAWSSIEPITDIGGHVVGLSTAKGEGNDFHHRWTGAEAGTNIFKGLFIPWWAVPGRDEAWHAEKAANMEYWQLCQEYPSNPEEAFIGSGNPFFDLDRLRGMELKDPIQRIDIKHIAGSHRWEKYDGAGDLLVWEEPHATGKYVVGADVAMGLEHGDWSVAWVMEATSGRLVACYRSKIDPDLYGSEILPAVGYYYNHALVCAEVNNHGLTTLKAMQRAGYTRLYRRRTATTRQEGITESVGFQTNYANKPKLMDFLAEYLRSNNVPHRETVSELKGFVRDQVGERVKLHGSPHDDLVMALAFCVEARKYAVENQVFRVKDHDVPGSIAWWSKQLEGKDKKKGLKVGI